MDDYISILNNMSLNSEWHEKADKAVSDVLTLYSKICYMFEKDKKYGEHFVKDNQELMGQLTIAATNSMNK